MRPLWQTLLNLIQKKEKATLDCDECFELLEYLVEVSALTPAKMEKPEFIQLQDVARIHLNSCPHCREHHLHLLEEMEAQLSNEKRITNSED